jgi:hypothetical protein
MAAGAHAADTELPPELQVDGLPTEPYCMEHFFGDGSRFEPVELRNCGMDAILPTEAAHLDEKGNYGYEYSYADSGEGLSRSYIYYRYLGRRQGLPVLFLSESGGGSGQFTAIVTVKREGDTLKLAEEIASGDRCNGGLDASMQGDELNYTQNITPYDFIKITDDNPHNLNAYDDLEASASSCFGAATYSNGKLAHVTLTADGEDMEGWTDRLPYQPCFNGIYREYLQQGKTVLDMEALKAFTHKFNTTCVDQPNKPE